MTRRRTAAVLLLAGVLLSACAGPDRTTPPTDVSLPGSPAELPSMDFAGFANLLKSLEGTPVVVNVWASWCVPCRDEATALGDAARRYDGRVQFVGVDVLDTRPDARAFIEEFDWPYPSVYDQDAEIRDRLGLLGQPVTQFYDAEGNLVDQHTGALDTDALETQLAALAAASGAS